MNTGVVQGTHARIFLLVLLPLLIASVYLVSSHPLTAIAAVICLVTMVPIIVRDQKLDLFSPWNYMFYFVVLNVLLRSVFIDFEIAGTAERLDDVFFLGKSKDFMIGSTGVLLFGFVFLTVGYMLPPNRAMQLNFRIFRTEEWDHTRFNGLMALMLLVSIVSLCVFISLTFTGVGEFAVAMLSRHRGLSDDLSEYRAHGYLRLLIGLSNVVAYLTYVRLRTKTRDWRYHRVVFAAAILVSLSMAFYSQSRAALIFVFLNIVFIKYYLDGQRFPWMAFTILAPLIIAVFFVISSFRGGSGVDLSDRLTPVKVIAPIILHSGGIDASKTGHVIEYVNDTQDYKFGQTLVQLIWAVVPRSMWTGKPVNLDTYIGEKIYGAQTYGSSGVPPGFFAEMYLNYWYAGIVLGALVLGVFMKVITNILIANKHNSNFVLCYVIGLQQLGMSVLGSGVSSTIMGVLASGVPLVMALYFITPKLTVTPRRQELC